MLWVDLKANERARGRIEGIRMLRFFSAKFRIVLVALRAAWTGFVLRCHTWGRRERETAGTGASRFVYVIVGLHDAGEHRVHFS